MPDSSISAAAPIPFAPVAVAPRHDGWTPARQRDFIDALAQIGCVTAAAKHVGKSAKSAYRLRDRADAGEFAAAWIAAIDHGRVRVRDTAIARALSGEVIPVFYKGQKVGERVRYDDRLVLAVLRRHSAELYGVAPSAREWDDFCP